jgi:hypothetical protein
MRFASETLRSIAVTLRHLTHSVVRHRAAEPGDAGMSTAEYAVGTLAACAFAAMLFKIVTSDAVRSEVTGLITRALHAAM